MAGVAKVGMISHQKQNKEVERQRLKQWWLPFKHLTQYELQTDWCHTMANGIEGQETVQGFVSWTNTATPITEFTVNNVQDFTLCQIFCNS